MLLYLIEEGSSWLVQDTVVVVIVVVQLATSIRSRTPPPGGARGVTRALTRHRARPGRLGLHPYPGLLQDHQVGPGAQGGQGAHRQNSRLAAGSRRELLPSTPALAAGGVESLTEKYDRLAFRYLLLPLLLLVAGYSVYCLLTWYYRSWYSWLLESLVALVYGEGGSRPHPAASVPRDAPPLPSSAAQAAASS